MWPQLRQQEKQLQAGAAVEATQDQLEAPSTAKSLELISKERELLHRLYTTMTWRLAHTNSCTECELRGLTEKMSIQIFCGEKS